MIAHTFRLLLISLMAWLPLHAAPEAPIAPDQVAILYNSKIPASKELAEFYASMRKIPESNLIPLPLSEKRAITRADYNNTIRNPLRRIMQTRGWWTMGKDKDGRTLVTGSKITTLVCMRGVPYQISRTPVAEQEKELAKKLPKPFASANEACVDSELAMCGVDALPTLGPINNPYFKKDTSISRARLPFLLLVGRIDGPDYNLCKRLIGDALATEATGLWGMCYLDVAKKGGGFAIGDEWLENIANRNLTEGIPTVVDRNKNTFTTNYPMNDAAVYFGWYTASRNGPLLNPKFKFRRGAVAVHLHSFSAGNIHNANGHWTGPILAKGAAATVGNVYEPYLHLTHHFDVFYDRLLKGYSLVEAAYMASPGVSWQNIVVGDPLYRPFLHLNGSGEKAASDRDFRAIRIASERWGDDSPTMVKKLRTAAASKSNARLYEYLGLWYRAKGDDSIAIAFFQSAAKMHMKGADRLRQWLHTADIHRAKGDKEMAIATLKKAKQTMKDLPEIKSVIGLLNILDPPPPPPAKEAAAKKKKKPVKK